MKMKRFFYIAAVAMAVLSACTKEDPIVEVGTEPESVSMPVFKATIEGPATKTTLGESGKVNWENGDEVVLFFETEDMENTWVYNYQVTPDNDDASKATLTLNTVLDEPSDGEVGDRLSRAIYPASLWSGEFPETQVYAGDDNIGFAPMCSYNWDLENFTVKPTPETIEFKNAAALLKITVPYTQMTSVRSITVSSDVAMHGYLSFSVRDYSLFITDGRDPGVNDHLILDCYGGNGNANVEIPEGDSKTFYIALPIPVLADGEKYGYLQIDVTDGTTTKSMRTTKASGIQIERNKIYPINFAENYTVAAWETALTLGKSFSNGATSIEIQTGVNISSYTEDATHKKLNAAGTLWEFLDGQVLRIQTSSNRIIAPVNSSFLFGKYYKVESITGLDKLDMSAVTDIKCMFMYCQELRSLNLSSFNTSNVTNMGSMFFNCYNLTEIIGIENFNTSSVTDMSGMFSGCSGLTALDVTSFNTSSVTDMSDMFFNCENLTTLDFTNFITSNVINMHQMFSGCWALQGLDLSYFDTENVTDMSDMFAVCQSLSALDVAYFNTSKVTNMSQMFDNCEALESLDITSFDTGSVEYMNSMFAGCANLTSLRIGENFSMSNVTNKWYMFADCGSRETSFCVYAVNNDDWELEFALSDGTGWDWYMQFEQIWE